MFARTLVTSSRTAASRSAVKPVQVMAVRGMKSKPIFTSSTTVKGARQGSIVGENLDLKLSTSKILGKPNDGKTNPEEMFSGGFAACFASACNAVAMQRNITLPEDLVVESTVALCGDLKKLDIFLEVELKVKTPEGVDKATMKEIVEKAEEVCPYSRAVRGNIDVSVSVV